MPGKSIVDTAIGRLALLAALLLAGPAQATEALDECDCSCPSYRYLVDQLESGEPSQSGLSSCAPACAIAWNRCEIQSGEEHGEDDQQTIAALLKEFLEGASRGDPDMHDRFWSDQLVYTSSAGQRFGKDELMAGLEAPTTPGQGGPSYSARDVHIRTFDGLAVLDFTLVAEAPDDHEQIFLNSGVFKREQDGQWRVINWQATFKNPESGR